MTPDYENDPQYAIFVREWAKKKPKWPPIKRAQAAAVDYRAWLAKKNAGPDGYSEATISTDPVTGVTTVIPGGAQSPSTINKDNPLRLSPKEASVTPNAPPPIDAVINKAAHDFYQNRPEAEQDVFLNGITDESVPTPRANRKKKAASKQAFKFDDPEKEVKTSQTDKSRRPAQYTTQYFSGSQAQIYFNDVLIDEISNIQYTTITNKAPIYGYASELFDTLAAGNLIIQGSFTINYIEAGYLPIIAMAMLERKFAVGAVGRMTDRSWIEAKPRLDHRVGLGRVSENVSQFPTAVMPDTKLDVSTYPTSILSPNSYLAAQALNQVRSLGNKEFRELSRQAMYNKITKEGEFSGVSKVESINGIRIPSRFDLIPPFDIYLICGDFADPKADHTVRKLKDVYLTGQAQTVISNGEPVQESYTFVARTLE